MNREPLSEQITLVNLKSEIIINTSFYQKTNFDISLNTKHMHRDQRADKFQV